MRLKRLICVVFHFDDMVTPVVKLSVFAVACDTLNMLCFTAHSSHLSTALYSVVPSWYVVPSLARFGDRVVYLVSNQAGESIITLRSRV